MIPSTAMSLGQRSLDSFRAERRQSEYLRVIEVLPGVLSNIVLDYAQLDDGILKRITRISFIKSHIEIHAVVPLKNITGQPQFWVMNDTVHETIYGNYRDIFAACYHESYAVFIDDMRYAIKTVLGISAYLLSHDNGGLIGYNVVDRILWPTW